MQSWQCNTSNAENAVCSEPSRRTIFILRESGLASLSPLLWPTGKELCLVKLQMRLGQSWHWLISSIFFKRDETSRNTRWIVMAILGLCLSFRPVRLQWDTGFVSAIPGKSELTAFVQCLTIYHYISYFNYLQFMSQHFTIFHNLSFMGLLHVSFVWLGSVAMLVLYVHNFLLASAGFRGGGNALTKLWPTSQPRHSRSAVASIHWAFHYWIFESSMLLRQRKQWGSSTAVEPHSVQNIQCDLQLYLNLYNNTDTVYPGRPRRS